MGLQAENASTDSTCIGYEIKKYNFFSLKQIPRASHASYLIQT